MNISKKRWSQLKQELPTLIFFCVFQLWYSLSYPPFAAMGFFGNIICAIALTILVGCACGYAFLFPEPYINWMNMTFFDDIPGPDRVKAKKWFKITMFVIVHILYFYVWYINFAGRPTSWYILFYGLSVIMFVLTLSTFRRIEANMHSNG